VGEIDMKAVGGKLGFIDWVNFGGLGYFTESIL
jgi:hypothetical protein